MLNLTCCIPELYISITGKKGLHSKSEGSIAYDASACHPAVETSPPDIFPFTECTDSSMAFKLNEWKLLPFNNVEIKISCVIDLILSEVWRHVRPLQTAC